MGCLGGEHAEDGLLAVHHNLAGGQDAGVHAANVGNSQKAALLNTGDHHADLVKMGVHQDLGGIRAAALFNEQVIAQGVGSVFVEYAAY